MSFHNKGQRCTNERDCQCAKHCLCHACLFDRRSRSLYSGLQSRLKEKRWKTDQPKRGIHAGDTRIAKRELPFSIDQFRAWLTVVLEDTPQCEYCHDSISITTISPDHAVPMTRGGSLAIANLRGACSSCNSAKGSLLPGEFKSLLTGLRTFTEAGRNDVMKRLRGGILHFGNRKKEVVATNVLVLPAKKVDPF